MTCNHGTLHETSPFLLVQVTWVKLIFPEMGPLNLHVQKCGTSPESVNSKRKIYIPQHLLKIWTDFSTKYMKHLQSMKTSRFVWELEPHRNSSTVFVRFTFPSILSEQSPIFILCLAKNAGTLDNNCSIVSCLVYSIAKSQQVLCHFTKTQGRIF